ncbi:DNA cytosine methyltransferase [Sphingosinicella ginsenosidimutans]|uniref:DNA cytosine methyltransferase n=1 Tax=Allosphingosinicella ginsenosidimutans TaxID=1176539 RepID=UPI00311C9C9D
MPRDLLEAIPHVAPAGRDWTAGIVVDNFAGGGGASTGIEAALGRDVDVAVNHDPEAIAMHIANHPRTRHHCQSIWSIDPLDAVTIDGRPRPVFLAWFSPDCTHHSKARGGKPREKNIRDLAWVVIHWIERLGPALKPAIICLENVEEFLTWGPLDGGGSGSPSAPARNSVRSSAPSAATATRSNGGSFAPAITARRRSASGWCSRRAATASRSNGRRRRTAPAGRGPGAPRPNASIGRCPAHRSS